MQEIPIEEVVLMNANMQALGGRSELSEVCFADVQVSNGSQEFIYIYIFLYTIFFLCKLHAVSGRRRGG